MIRTAAVLALGLLEFRAPRPTPAPLDPLSTQDTTPLPDISQQLKRVRKRRSKHICHWTDQEVWAVFFFGLLLGAFVMYTLQ